MECVTAYETMKHADEEGDLSAEEECEITKNEAKEVNDDAQIDNYLINNLYE